MNIVTSDNRADEAKDEKEELLFQLISDINHRGKSPNNPKKGK